MVVLGIKIPAPPFFVFNLLASFCLPFQVMKQKQKKILTVTIKINKLQKES